MKRKMLDTIGLIIECKERKAGEGTFDGKLVKWDDAYIITILPLESTKMQVRKFVIAPSQIEYLTGKLDDIYWGTLAELVFDGKYVTDVNILSDWLGAFYETQES